MTLEREIVDVGERGNGRTTRQMLAAPRNCVFIWNNSDLQYAKDLAAHLGRTDLAIVRPDWLITSGRGCRDIPGLVLDHAVRLTDEQRDIMLDIVRYRIEKGPGAGKGGKPEPRSNGATKRKGKGSHRR